MSATPTRDEMVALIADGLASRDGKPGHHVEAGQILAAYVEAQMPWNHTSVNEFRPEFEDD